MLSKNTPIPFSQRQQALKWFETFCEKYGGWIHNQAKLISDVKSVLLEDAKQDILTKAWQACLNPGYDPQKGKTPNGWIYQFVSWHITTTLLAENDPTVSLSSLYEKNAAENFSLAEFTDWLATNSHQDTDTFSAGSQQLVRSSCRVEADFLIEKILSVAKELPEKYRTPLVELLQPSIAFREFMLQKKEQQGDNKQEYTAACKFENCNTQDLLEFTGLPLMNLQVAIRFVQKRIPELQDYSGEGELTAPPTHTKAKRPNSSLFDEEVDRETREKQST